MAGRQHFEAYSSKTPPFAALMPVSPHQPHVAGLATVPLRTRVIWRFGGLADNLMFNTLTAPGTLVYVNHFKLTPALPGLALGLPRIFDVVSDPIIGNMSDNAKSLFRCRRPLMFAGVLGCVLLLPLLWTSPMTAPAPTRGVATCLSSKSW